MPDQPLPSPEACLEVAHNHQNEYERLSRDRNNGVSRIQRETMFHHGAMAENNALLAIAGFLQYLTSPAYLAELARAVRGEN